MLTPRSLSLTALVFALHGLARGSDLPVTYNVQDKPLKAGAPAGTQLTFTLYSDNACTQQVYQAMIPVENVTRISKFELATPKSQRRHPPRTRFKRHSRG